MKTMSCEDEASIIQAMLTGQWTDEVHQHAAECPECSQAVTLAEALRAEARRAEAAFQPPDAHWVFERSRRLAREIALRRMALILIGIRTLAAAYVVGATGWFLRGYMALPYREIASSMSKTSAEFALMGAAVAVVSLIGGLWPILRDRPGQS
jgi:predicted anti-sigma-YlaC factor YlaD